MYNHIGQYVYSLFPSARPFAHYVHARNEVCVFTIVIHMSISQAGEVCAALSYSAPRLLYIQIKGSFLNTTVRYCRTPLANQQGETT